MLKEHVPSSSMRRADQREYREGQAVTNKSEMATNIPDHRCCYHSWVEQNLQVALFLNPNQEAYWKVAL
jgi:hypothetical protein